MATPRILLVGAGSMGSLHARVISQSPFAELVRVVDPSEEIGSALAERFGAPQSIRRSSAGRQIVSH